jgi:hypothetical protein
MFLQCSNCISLILNMDLVPLESICVVSDMIDDSYAVDAVFMDSWQVFCRG